MLERGVGNARDEVLVAVAECGADSSPLVRLRAALGAHLKYTLRHHFSSRLKAIRRLPKRLRDQHMQQERDYAAIFAGLLAEAGRKGLLQSGFDPSVVRMLAMGALTWAAEWYDPQGAMTPDDVTDELMRVLTKRIAEQPVIIERSRPEGGEVEDLFLSTQQPNRSSATPSLRSPPVGMTDY